MLENKKIHRAVKSIETRTVKTNTDEKTKYSLGLTLLNLGATGNPDFGAFGGTIVNYVGASGVGKTLFILTALADIVNTPGFDDVDIYYNDAERASRFNIARIFGEKLENKIKAPRIVDGIPSYSTTVEEFKDDIFKLCAQGRRFVYVQDSLDALTCDAEIAKSEEDMAKREKGKEVSGTYGAEKAKMMSSLFRQVTSKLSDSDSLLIVISQVRDKMNAGPYESKDMVTGGRALEFFSSTRIRLARKERIKVELHGHDRIIGNTIKTTVTKNKSTGKESEFFINNYYSYGADEVGSNIDYLLYEKIWTKTKGIIDTKGFISEPVKESEIIKIIEDSSAQQQLKELVHKTWIDIEEKLKVDRKPRWS